MKQEFVTSEGKLTIDNGVLIFDRVIRRMDYKHHIGIVLALTFAFRLFYAFGEQVPAKRSLEFMLYGVGTLIWTVPLLYRLLHRSQAKKIHLQKIESYQFDEESNELETHVRLNLRSGRIRIIPFRNLENQMESFLAVLAANNIPLSEPQLT